MSRPRFIKLFFSGVIAAGMAAGADDDAEKVRFFEERVRPVLVGNCQKCHNDQAKMSGLSLSSRETAMLGGSRGSAVIPGQADKSLLVQAIHRSGDLKMPPDGPLPADDVAALTDWIRQGAVWGNESPRERATASHWAFQKVQRASPPSLRNTSKTRNAIDYFVQAKLDEKGVAPSPEADRRTLIRRLSLDLTGLPPTREEVREFLDDRRPDAYERVVERLLASPHYGERWGRHWLDIARYADSNGYSIDGNRSIWRYRDWVIDSLNRDMPFDRFVIEQLAGDLLPNPTQEQLTATGFHRNTMINQEGGIDYEQYRVEAVVDRVSTTGTVFLGLTVGCARCHDHKFDPISQREFYRLFSFFNNIDELGGNIPDGEGPAFQMQPLLEFGKPEDFARREAVNSQVETLEAELLQYQKLIEQDWQSRFELSGDTVENRIPEILKTPIEDRATIDRQLLKRFFSERDPAWKARQDGIQALHAEAPKLESTLIMRELPAPRESYIHVQGDFTRKGSAVEPGALAVLPPLPKSDNPNRLDLARWLVSQENPMTPRVTMNRLWQRYFGLGIVETENDFGSQGTAPSHPELLDWLAAEFIRRDWSLKAMHRLVVASATYRQASAARPDAAKVDPSNRLLARQNRLRLEAEIIRDSGLAVSGLLTPTIGGPSVFPPRPAGAGQFTQVDRAWKTEQGPNRYRRGMYTFFRRSAAYPGLALFDAPDAQTSTTRRNTANTPLQALTLLNDEAQIEFAENLAKRILAVEGGRDARIRLAFEICLARIPDEDERQTMTRYLTRMTDAFATNGQSAAPREAAWLAASRVMLNLDEFVTRQ